MHVVDSLDEAVAVANEETSGLAAGIVTEDEDAAARFLDGCRGTAAFWHASTRFTDGFALTGAPETGINVDWVPGPRGPVTYRDLWLRQYVVDRRRRRSGDEAAARRQARLDARARRRRRATAARARSASVVRDGHAGLRRLVRRRRARAALARTSSAGRAACRGCRPRPPLGQPLLQRRWEDALAAHGVRSAQVLLTAAEIADRRAYVNARNTLDELQRIGVVPVVNENDATATDEISFGDNDTLAAQVAVLVRARTARAADVGRGSARRGCRA